MLRTVILVCLVGLLASAAYILARTDVQAPSERAAPPRPEVLVPIEDTKRLPPADSVLSVPPAAPESIPTTPVRPTHVGSIIDGVWIEDGTPPSCLKSCIEGYKPAKVFADGSQVFENMPGKVRNAQGLMEDRKVTITVNPAKAIPVDPAALGK